MADNLKPYDPNIGFISFRLNPDAIIDELGNQIPYRNTIVYSLMVSLYICTVYFYVCL